MLARRDARALRQQKAATAIQTAYRRHKMRQQYQEVVHNITHLQVRGRQHLSNCTLRLRGMLPLG
jgi:fatty acid-binding protein DegV